MEAIELRKKEEQVFHSNLRKNLLLQRWSPEMEETIQSNPMWVNMKYYAIERKSRSMVMDWLEKNCQGKRVLDYCCGNGEDTIFIAQIGAEDVVGIDISHESIKNCQQKAVIKGVQDKTSFRIMDAEAMEFEDNSFDIITEYGALHHIDLNKAYPELVRVLKQDGKMICTEALGHNLIIHFYRKKTPHLRTEWEIGHILKKKDIEIAKRYFRKAEIRFFHLATLAAVLFRKRPGFNVLLGLLESIDSVLLKIPLLKWQAWQIVFVLSEPIK